MNYPDILHHRAKDGVTGSCQQLLMGAQHSRLIDYWLFRGAETSAISKSVAECLVAEFSLGTTRPWALSTCISIMSGTSRTW